MTLSLRELAIATEQNLWEIKLADRPKSSGITTQPRTMPQSWKSSAPGHGLIFWRFAEARVEKVADIGAADGIWLFSWRKEACQWRRIPPRLAKGKAKPQFRGIPLRGASEKSMCLRMAGSNCSLQTATAVPLWPIGSRQAPPMSFASMIQITRSCWQNCCYESNAAIKSQVGRLNSRPRIEHARETIRSCQSAHPESSR